jgi:soluble lytic murein transglycosylase-like protein
LNQKAVSKTQDFGVMQINEKYNGDLAEKLGYDIHNEDDNILFGVYLIWKDGAKRHYSASSKCWKPKVRLAIS